jgi:antitoxin MazE
MGTVLKARVIKIGNSHGVRIPKVWLDQLALGDEVEMAMEAEQIVIRPAHRPREQWEAEFRAMAARGDDQLLPAPAATEFDQDEWTW